jgi:hypothetical protein
MTNVQSATLRDSLVVNESGTNADTGETFANALSDAYSQDLSEGTTAASAQFDALYTASGTIAASGTATIDLAAALTTRIGTAAVFAKVKGIRLRNLTSTTGVNLQLGAGSNPVASIWAAAGDAMKVGPGGLLVWFSPIDGFAVTAGSADVLTITNLNGCR